MLYVTITTASGRSTRGRYETDDPAEAIRQALDGAALEPTRDNPGAKVIGVLVEEQGTQLEKGALAEALEEVRDAEARRARQE